MIKINEWKEDMKMKRIGISIVTVLALLIVTMVGFSSKAEDERPLKVHVRALEQKESEEEVILQISIKNQSENTYPAETLRIRIINQENILEGWRIVKNDVVDEQESAHGEWQAVIKNELKPNAEISFEICGIAGEKFYKGSEIVVLVCGEDEYDSTCYGQYVYVPVPFTDVSEEEWFYDYVARAYFNRTMTGLTQTTFGPGEELSRAQFATILWRDSGEPEMNYEERFSDVANGQFYTDAALWAQGEGVVTGYEDGRFGPSDTITREQIATMLYRYMVKCYMGGNKPETMGVDLSVFPDSENVSDFSREAMNWAIEIGLIKGDNGRINPQGNASRAVCATIMTRFNDYLKSK